MENKKSACDDAQIIAPTVAPESATPTPAVAVETLQKIAVTDGKAKITDLHPHPENVKIYGHKDSVADLVKHIEESGTGILQPLMITPTGEIIGGHRRFRAAQHLKLEEVPVQVFNSTDELEILMVLLGLNRQRVKTGVQIANEATLQTRIKKEMRDREKQQRTAEGANLPRDAKGKIRDEVAKDLGLSGRTVDKAVTTSKAIAKLRIEGKEEDAQEVEAALNKSVERGLKLAVEKGAVAKPKAKKKPAVKKAPRKAVVASSTATGATVTDVDPNPSKNPNAAEETSSEASILVAPAPSPAPAPASNGNPNADSGTALTYADHVVTFLRSESAKAMQDQQRRDWKKVLDQIAACGTALKL